MLNSEWISIGHRSGRLIGNVRYRSFPLASLIWAAYLGLSFSLIQKALFRCNALVSVHTVAGDQSREPTGGAFLFSGRVLGHWLTVPSLFRVLGAVFFPVADLLNAFPCHWWLPWWDGLERLKITYNGFNICLTGILIV